MTLTEMAARPKDYTLDNLRGRDLEGAAQRKETSAFGMKIALFPLLLKAGLSSHLGVMADRGLWIFDPGFHNLYQLDGEMIGVPDPLKGMLWLDPGLRFAASGVISGVPGYARPGL